MPVLNNSRFVSEAIKSFNQQSYDNRELIIKDGASTDGTLSIISSYSCDKIVCETEPDSGIYNALNKGIETSTGDVIGFLHSDDVLYNDRVLSDILSCFINHNVDVVYGDLIMVDRFNGKVIRKWRPSNFAPWKLFFGWAPGHPAVFYRRSVFEKHGQFDETLRISSDYDYLLRVFSDQSLKFYYYPKILCKMRLGGTSTNRSFAWRKLIEDYVVVKRYNRFGFITIFFKKVFKITQFF